MGTETDDQQAVATDAVSADDVLGVVSRWYHVPALAVLMLFMFWTRFQNAEVFRRGGDGFWLQAVDSWYHWRTINWTVENYPWVMGFDPWTGFPEGTLTGQFGTIFDWIVATVAMVLGLGSPGEQDILLAGLITVPAMAALTAIPVYYMAKRVGTRAGAVAGVAFLALVVGQFFARSTAGQFQHHAAEALFMAVAVLAMMVAVTVAERDRPIWELVVARSWGELRRPAKYSALAGVALTLYMWVWPPGIVLVGIFGAYFVVQLSFDYVRGRSPDHIAFVAAVSMGVTALLMTTRIQESGFSATSLDYMGPTLPLLVAAGAVFMAWLARTWERQALDRRLYPGAVGAAVVGSLVVIWLVLPSLYSELVGNLTGRMIPFGYSPGALTVAEVQPPDSVPDFLVDEYGMGFFVAVLGAVALLLRPFFGRPLRAQELLVVVWSVFLFSMAITQVRFNYYFPMALAVLSGAAVGIVVKRVGLGATERLTDLQTYQVLAVAVVAMLLFAPMLPPLASVTPVAAGGDPDPESGIAGVAPSGDAVKFEPATEWMNENTPAIGAYGGADNAGDLEYYGQYGVPDGDMFDYPEGAYGVLSWWDYGHLITTQAERIPHANPFQQNSRSASAALTAQSEEQAQLYLDAIAAGASVTHERDEAELRDAIAESDTENGIEYVMIDDESAAGKFPAITEWTGPDYDEYLDNEQITLREGQEETLPVTGEEYQDTLLASLYLDDAQGLESFRLVQETPRYSLVGFQLTEDGVGQSSQVFADDGYTDDVANVSAAADQSRQFGQVGPGGFYDAHVAASVKVFERVEGATITGETDATNGSVTATLELETSTDRPFRYVQTADVDNGEFELTVPYPTAETLGPDDGYANASVRMAEDAGGYGVFVQNETGQFVETAENVSVDEEAIQFGEILDVDLEPFEPEPDGAPDDENDTETGTNDGDGTDEGDEGTDGSEDGDGNQTDSIVGDRVLPTALSATQGLTGTTAPLS